MDNLDFTLQWPMLEDDSCAQVYELLQNLIRAFEYHYGAQLNAYYSDVYADNTQGDQRFFDDEIPF